jgi:hypothetical protein
MALRPVGFAVARVALHRNACSKGYKLSREEADLRSLVRGGAWMHECLVVVNSSRFDLCVVLPAFDVAPASPFIASKGRARVTLVVKR